MQIVTMQTMRLNFTYSFVGKKESLISHFRAHKSHIHLTFI